MPPQLADPARKITAAQAGVCNHRAAGFYEIVKFALIAR